jgi:CubicO group peptidase (beta-lactamase class C family)
MTPCSRSAIALAAAALLGLLAIPAALTAQTPLDTVLRLNRDGQWAEAADVARRALADSSIATTAERCRLTVVLAYSHTRLGQIDAGRAAVTDAEALCADMPAADWIWRELDSVRNDLAPNAAAVVTARAADSTADAATSTARAADSTADAATSTARAADSTADAATSTARAAGGFWRAADAGSMGLDPLAVEEHRRLCVTTGADACLVAYHGRLVQEWYADRFRVPAMAMSTTKSITAILVGMLIDDGKIESVDQPVCAFLESWCDDVRGQVTLHHLLSMTSGLPRYTDRSVGFASDKNAFVEPLRPTATPGTTWAYSNEGVQLLSPVLDRAAGEPVQDYAARRLFAPLGMDDTRLHLDVRGHAWTYADMETTPRDLARIGLLMLQQGAWNGRQIVSAAWIEALTRPSQPMNAGYGLLWWLHEDPRGFAGHGHLDTHLHVFPDLDLIVVRMQARPAAGVPEGTYEAALLPIVRRFVAAGR